MDREQAHNLIAELDRQAYDIVELLSIATDDDERETLTDEVMAIAVETNRLLKMIDAPESEMYNL